jgi:transposase
LLSAANTHDSKMIEPLLDAIAPIRRPRGRPRKRPAKLHADKGYDYPRCRRALSRHRINVRIARRGVESSEKLDLHRWVVERTLAWLSKYRRLRVRYERRVDLHEAFVVLGCALITWGAVQRYRWGLLATRRTRRRSAPSNPPLSSA